jgi:multiple sugar transport system permease protein
MSIPISRRKLTHKWNRFRTFVVLGLPATALYSFAVVIPLVLAIRYSLLDFNLLTSEGPFVGMKNYFDVLTDPSFWRALGFTGLITIWLLIAANAGGVGLALLLNRRRKLFNGLRTLAFVPSILSGVVLAYIWATILTDKGVLNRILSMAGLGALQTSWLGSPFAAQASVIFVSAWPSIGFATVVYLAGLQSIPTELIEAAAVDGAGPIRTFRAITWPLLQPSLFVTSTMMVIGGVKSYDISVILTGGGPAAATETPALQILRHGFAENRAGYANSEAMLLLLLIVLISIAGYAISRRRGI